MEIKYIRNMDDVSLLCLYNLETGEYQIRKYSIPLPAEVRTDIGFFADVNHDIFGVCSSNHGPVFFKNAERFYLKQIAFSMEHHKLNDKTGEFLFITNNEVRIDEVYSITTLVDYDVWSQEKDVDVFQWLNNAVKDDMSRNRFFNYYTR